MRELPIGTSASIRVPASSANLGPGFDTLGLALGLYDDLTAEVIDSGLELTIEGEGAEVLPRTEKHLVIRAIHLGLAEAGVSAPGLRVHCVNRIPQSRGLGSSASAAVGGVALANALAGRVLSDEQMVHLSATFEGHPDNSSASVLGGVVVSWTESTDGETEFKAVSLAPHPSLRATALVPSVHASTNEVRKLLPASVPHIDARFNVSRAALFTYAVQHDPSLLMEATKDRLHQTYRATALPVTTEWVERMREAGLAAFVSGAGPTALALHTDEFPASLRADAVAAGLRVLDLPIVAGVEYS
ncbi:Homoserine kinase [Corynebacterium kalinowskii]|uniref:Homoserine kinase n=1 Tax=Corynebacterium kalinowskii TaxID=2675216 RepID=A0A6B8V9J8_9CORY|nr:homoserine kinase [Corynebacterium kalinowskii]QGU01772.1 Homoserine kinase [Corynebacterium kalinowskii]